jgi:hypothetical protein
MMTMTGLRLSIAILFAFGRRVAMRYRAELKLLTLFATAYFGSDYINSVAEYGVCLYALLRKYGLDFLKN